MGWHFLCLFHKVAPVSLPVLVIGLLTCYLVVEKLHSFGRYGAKMPGNIRSYLLETATGMHGG